MLKRLIFAAFMAAFAFVATPAVHAAQIANVDYVHQVINRKLADMGATTTLKQNAPNAQAVNMKYLLTAVDAANEILNGAATTNYGTGTYATTVAADTVATNVAAETFIKENLPSWSLTTTPDTDSFSFTIDVAGNFTIDWGDGAKDTFESQSVKSKTFSHTYDTAGAYTIKITGRATGHLFNEELWHMGSTIRFGDKQNIASVSGGLGRVFAPVGAGYGYEHQPSFIETFSGCTNLKSIPADLFTGVSGTWPKMFYRTFENCTGLTSIPENLFADVRSVLSEYDFLNEMVFTGTFSGCTGLTSIPENLFSGISGKPHYALSIFGGTFAGCTGLTSIPENLFGDISGPSDSGDWGAGLDSSVFGSMFEGCTSLTGPSARINGRYLYEIWPDATTEQVGGCYKDATGLSDWDNIPDAWKEYPPEE